MSSYYDRAIDPATGREETVFMIDDYFGRHRYGVMFPDGRVLRPEEIRFVVERLSAEDEEL